MSAMFEIGAKVERAEVVGGEFVSVPYSGFYRFAVASEGMLYRDARRALSHGAWRIPHKGCGLGFHALIERIKAL